MTPPIGLILLAAGGATRMGTPKQLLRYRGRTLLRHAAEVAVASGLTPVLVVLGAQADILKVQLTGLPVRTVVHEEWDKGVGGSIRAGIQALQAASAHVEAVVITLCDQPLVGPDDVARLVESHRATGKPIVASAYGGTLGVPALFDRGYFPQLAELADKGGAKQVIAHAAGAVHAIPFPAGAFDIDTPQDYQRLRARDNGQQS